jgi:hypothetical protein
MKLGFLASILLGLVYSLNAQNYINEHGFEKYKNYRDSISQMLVENDLQKIKVKRYFDLKEGEIAFLQLNEEEMLLLIIGEFDTLLKDISIRKTKFYKGINSRRIDTEDKQAAEAYKYFFYDSLTINTKKYIKEYEQEIRKNIWNSELTFESKDFLSLFLDYYIAHSDFCDRDFEKKMISNSKLFLQKYPKSIYKDFILDYINIEFTEGNWGVGMYFNMGTILYTDGLKKTLTNPTLIYVSWNLNYKKFDVNIGMGGSIYSKIKNPFYYDTVWQTNHQYTFSPIVEATLGYHLIEKRKLNITPFIGVGYLGLNGKLKDDSLY